MRPAFCRREPWTSSTRVDAGYAACNNFHYALMNSSLSGRLAGECNPTKTLYNLLGARPDDNAEGLRRAFRKAAKANHPDLHTGDPDAPMRFRQIVEAYEILRDAERRATYDRLLKFGREQHRWNLRRTISYLMQNIVADAITVACLAIVLAGGYMLVAHVSKTPVAELVGIAAREPVKIAAVEPAAQIDTTEPDELRDKLEPAAAPEMTSVPGDLASAANDGGALKVTKGRPAPNSAGLQTDVGKPDNDFAPPMDQADAKPATGRPERYYRIEPLNHDKAQSVEVEFSSLEKDNDIPKLPPPDFTMFGDKHHMKISDARDTNISDMKTTDMKIPEIKIPEKPRTVAKRRTMSRTTFEQASLENRNTSACSGSQSCSRDMPPLFGVGF
jgi:curved DNA-binding protein CbpA